MRKRITPVVVLLAMLALVVGCSKKPDDNTITRDIQAKMFSDTDLKTARLDVSVKNGEVTLSGEVPSAEAQLRAYKLAQSVAGVTKVNDQMKLQVAQAQPEPQPEPPPPPPKPKRKVTTHANPKPALTPPPAAPEPQPALQPAEEKSTPSPAPAAPPEPQPVRVQVPAGTPVVIRMIDSIDSKEHQPGQVFRASLDAPLTVDGDDIIPTGTDVWVKLVQSKSAGRIAGRSELELELYRMEFQGRTYQLVSNNYEQVGSSRGADTAKKVGIGAAVGAAIGAIAGGGKGAAIGAAVGGGAGTAVQIATRGEQVRVPSETRLDFRLQAPVTVTYTPGKSASRR